MIGWLIGTIVLVWIAYIAGDFRAWRRYSKQAVERDQELGEVESELQRFRHEYTQCELERRNLKADLQEAEDKLQRIRDVFRPGLGESECGVPGVMGFPCDCGDFKGATVSFEDDEATGG